MSSVVHPGCVITFTSFFLEEKSSRRRYLTNELPTTIILVFLSPLDLILILLKFEFNIIPFSFCQAGQTDFQNLAFWSASYHSVFYHLILINLVYQTGYLKLVYISETVQHALFEIPDPFNTI